MARLTMIVLVGPRNFEEILEKNTFENGDECNFEDILGKKHLIMEMNDY